MINLKPKKDSRRPVEEIEAEVIDRVDASPEHAAFLRAAEAAEEWSRRRADLRSAIEQKTHRLKEIRVEARAAIAADPSSVEQWVSDRTAAEKSVEALREALRTLEDARPELPDNRPTTKALTVVANSAMAEHLSAEAAALRADLAAICQRYTALQAMIERVRARYDLQTVGPLPVLLPCNMRRLKEEMDHHERHAAAQ